MSWALQGSRHLCDLWHRAATQAFIPHSSGYLQQVAYQPKPCHAPREVVWGAAL